MTREEKKAKRKEYLERRKKFFSGLKYLYAKKYRYSLRYEDALIKEDGKAYVNVDLTKIESPFSIFSYDKRINPEIYDYIDSAVYYLKQEVPVVINFDDGGKYSDEMKDKIKKCVIRHYSLAYEDVRFEHRKSIFFGFALFFIGLLCLTANILIEFFGPSNTPLFIDEITLIASWLFIWSSIDIFFVSGHHKREEILNAGQLALAEVTFDKPRN